MENGVNYKRNIILADIGIVFVALFWGGGFVAGKFALTAMTPMVIMAYRYAGAALVLLIFSFKKLHNINKKMILSGAVIGFLMFLGNLLQTIGLQYTTAGKQSFIISLYTVMVPFLSWLMLKEKPSKQIVIAAALALFGISMLTLTDDLTIGIGDWLTFLFAIAFSVQVVLIGIFMKDMEPMSFTFVQLAVAATLSIGTALIFDTPISLVGLPSASLIGLLYLVTFNTAFAFLLQNICQCYAPANHTAILLSTETVFGTFFAISVAGEIFTGRMIIGCIIMFIAIAVSNLPSRSPKEVEENS